MKVRTRVLAVAGLAALMPAGTAAQSNEPVPRELVMALLGMSRGYVDQSALFVGRAPPDMEAGLLPPNAQVLGSISFEGYNAIVLVFTEIPNAARRIVEDHLKQQGWAPLTPARVEERGFVGGPGFGPSGPLCKGDTFAMTTSMQRQGSGSLVTLMFSASPGGPCSQRERGGGRSWLEDYPIPALHPPPGLTSEGGSSGGGEDSRHLSTRLRGRATAVEVLRHYASQMSDGGWVGGAVVSGDGIATQMLTHPPKDQVPWTATLLVSIPSGASGIDVALLVRRLNKVRP